MGLFPGKDGFPMRFQNGKNVAKKIWHFFSEACAICVLLSLFLFLVMEATKGTVQPSMPLSQFSLVFLFSFVIALANRIFLLPLPFAVKLLLHYAVTGGGIFAVCAVVKKLSFSTPASLFAAIAIYTLLYAIIAAATLFILHLLNGNDKEKKEEQPYQKRF